MVKKSKEAHHGLAITGIVGIVAIIGLVMMFNGGITGAVPAQVYDVNTGQEIAVVDLAEGNCKFLNNGNLVCPGTPKANTELCVSSATEAGLTGDALLVSVQDCVTTLSDVNLATHSGLAPDGSCPMVDAIRTRATQAIANCRGSLNNDGTLCSWINSGEHNRYQYWYYSPTFDRATIYSDNSVFTSQGQAADVQQTWNAQEGRAYMRINVDGYNKVWREFC
jgi:hypothetical protein